VFLGHLRSALVPILAMSIATVAAFLPMYVFGVSANIMSLGGLALAVGVVVDAAIVMVENAHRRVSEPCDGAAIPFAAQPLEILRATTQVARPIFFSLAIIVVSFIPVFFLEGREGRLFRPLAATKTSAMVFASLLSLTFVPALLGWLVRGRNLLPQARNPLSRVCTSIYGPMLRLALQWRGTALVANFALIPLTVVLALSLGTEFMPPLFEGSVLYMPSSQPGLSITEATRLLQVQDRVLRDVPEVQQVFGTAGRGTSATDNSPMEMINTTITLKPRAEWRAGLTLDELLAEMEASLQVPGVTNVWTQPIRSRLDMLTTGMRTPVGIKVFGPDLPMIDTIVQQIEGIVRRVPGTRGVYAERSAQGMFTDVRIDRTALARYGLRVSDVQDVVQAAIGGQAATETLEGRERYSVSVRYARAFRDDLAGIERVLVTAPGGARVPLGDVARIVNTPGPAMIRNEDGRLTGYVYVDPSDRDLGGYVATAQQALVESLRLPPGYTWQWTGDYVLQLRAGERFRVLAPLVLGLICLLLYAMSGSLSEAALVMLSTAYAMTGGVVLQWVLGYNFSVAVWVGYLALFGVAVQTGVVMVMYLREALEARQAKGGPLTEHDVLAATLDGSILRLRPKLMTVCAVLASLLPVMWSGGVGSDVMKPIAAPIVGGMITSTVHVLIITPIIFYIMNVRALGRRAGAGLARGSVDG
jgi:Cu(I)/Ag(I) efflux system membrane protein CusA/SilA